MLRIGYAAKLALIVGSRPPAERDRDAAVARIESVGGDIGLAIGHAFDARKAVLVDAAILQKVARDLGAVDRQTPIIGSRLG